MALLIAISFLDQIFAPKRKSFPTDRNNPTDEKKKKKSCTHRLKKPTDEKLYQWASSISGKNLEVDFETDDHFRPLGCFNQLAAFCGIHNREVMS